MRVIESLIRGKNDDQSLCEDGIFIGSKIVAVIDGATSHGKLVWNGGRSGWFAKEVISQSLRDHEDELADLSAGEGMSRLNKCLAEKTEETRLLGREPSATVKKQLIEKWDGKLPETYAGDNIMGMFNIK